LPPTEPASSIWTTRFGGALVDHYVERDLSERRHSTQQSHSSTLNRGIRPHWGDEQLEQVKPVAVEEWLRSLTLAPRPRSTFEACFTLFMSTHPDGNSPIEIPSTWYDNAAAVDAYARADTDEIRLLLAQLAAPYHNMVLVAACLGLRASEIMGLQRQDFNCRISPSSSAGVVNGRVAIQKPRLLKVAAHRSSARPFAGGTMENSLHKGH